MKRVSIITLALAMATAAAPHAFADGETIAVLTKNQTNPFFQAERIGAAKAAAELHAKVIQYVPTQPDSIPEQTNQIDDVVPKTPDASVMVPVDYKAMVAGVKKMNDAKIPVVNVTDRSASGDFVAFVGADDYSIAKSTAVALLKAIGGKGDVIILEGVRGAATAQDRLRGFKDAIAEFPGVKLVDSQPGNYQRLQAMQVMENLLQSNPNVAGVMAANDAMAIGAMDALADASRPAKMLATADYNGFAQGCIGTEIAIRYLRHEPVPKKVIQPSVVVEKSNLAAYDIPVDQRSCPAWDQVPQN